MTAFAEKGGRAFGDEAGTAASDRGRRRLAPRSAASWPQAAPTSWPRLRRMVVSMPAARKVVAKRSMTGIGLAVHGVWATGFIGMRLT